MQNSKITSALQNPEFTNMKTPDVCHDHYNCCDCGGEECGCAYCFSCHACGYCKDGEGEHCELISNDDFARLTEEQKNLLC